MRCESCSKMVSVELADPEPDVSVENVDGNGSVTGAVRIVLTCADCSNELREASLDVDANVEISHIAPCEGDEDLEVEFSPESCDEYDPPKAKRQRHMYGAEGTITVRCSCGAWGTSEWKELVQSSNMEEL